MTLLGRNRRAASAALLSLAAAALSVLAAPLEAQAPRAGHTLLSINPLGLPFKYVAAEVEQRASTIASLGGSFSYIDIGDGSYLSVEAKLRLYPNEEVFRGFSVGLAGGVTRVKETISVFDGTNARDDARVHTAPSIAVIADYNWLLGKSKRVLVGTGIGAKRIFGDDDEFNDINFAYPTVRFQIGVLY